MPRSAAVLIFCCLLDGVSNLAAQQPLLRDGPLTELRDKTRNIVRISLGKGRILHVDPDRWDQAEANFREDQRFNDLVNAQLQRQPGLDPKSAERVAEAAVQRENQYNRHPLTRPFDDLKTALGMFSDSASVTDSKVRLRAHNGDSSLTVSWTKANGWFYFSLVQRAPQHHQLQVEEVPGRLFRLTCVTPARTLMLMQIQGGKILVTHHGPMRSDTLAAENLADLRTQHPEFYKTLTGLFRELGVVNPTASR